MNTQTGWTIVALLFAVIIVLAWVLFATPARVHAPTIPTASTSLGQAGQPRATGTPVAGPLLPRLYVVLPREGIPAGKKFTITGKAPGTWFFEASFPVQVRDANNNKIGEGIAQAQGNWTTTELVSFAATVDLATRYSGSATLVLLKDNPSGLPENDDSVSIPIVIQ